MIFIILSHWQRIFDLGTTHVAVSKGAFVSRVFEILIPSLFHVYLLLLIPPFVDVVSCHHADFLIIRSENTGLWFAMSLNALLGALLLLLLSRMLMFLAVLEAMR